MVLLMRLEMLREFGNKPAQKSNLYFWRPSIRFVLLIRGYNLPLCFDRQCHSTGNAPCLLLISIWYLNRITQDFGVAGRAGSRRWAASDPVRLDQSGCRSGLARGRLYPWNPRTSLASTYLGHLLWRTPK